MKPLLTLAIASIWMSAAYAQGIPHPAGSGNPMPDQTIELKDGTKIIHNANGVMYHVDQKGRRLSMSGKMEAVDGSVYIMRDDYVWKRVGKPGSRPHNP